MKFDAKSFSIECPHGTARFSGFATSPKPKLYIASVDEAPIYVGVTKQSMRTRLRLGWNADGSGGYHGYAWRRLMSEAVLDVWGHDDPSSTNQCLDLETVEAEVVFLIRCAGQWPLHQTEIHFHPSSDTHRAVARSIFDRYALNANKLLHSTCADERTLRNGVSSNMKNS
jgi:hypothetical protein